MRGKSELGRNAGIGRRHFLAGVSSAASLLAAGCSRTPAPDSKMLPVSSVDEFRRAVLRAEPGSIIEAADGDYPFDHSPLEISLRGTAERPIIVRARNRGRAQLTGEYSILLKDSSYVTVEGFAIHNRAERHALAWAPASDTWLEAMRDELPDQGSLVLYRCDHCRLTRLRIQLEEQRGFNARQLEERLPRMHWVNLAGGQFNRVDHCWIGGQRNSGVTLVVTSGENRFRIDRNHFAGRPPGNFNGFETLRLGSGNLSRLYGVIEENLFENCDGEEEIISFKSSLARLSRNTFLDCAGMIVARHGSHITVSYNHVLNRSEKEGVGGVRIHGNDCNVLNNYFEGLTGGGIVSAWGTYDMPEFDWGDPWFGQYDPSARMIYYARAGRAHIAFNSWIHCRNFLNLGDFQARELVDQSLPPLDWTLLNNLVVCREEPFIRGRGETGFRWMGNIFWNPDGPVEIGRELPEQGVRVADPRLERSGDGMWRLTADSPARNTARGWFWLAQHVPEYSVDIDGQPRDMTVKVTTPQTQSEFRLDVGADEYSEDTVVRRPLTPTDVGPCADEEED